MKRSGFCVLIVLLHILPQFVSAQNANLDTWVGKYSFEEEPIKANAGYAMAMQWDLTITKANNQFQGVLEVNGQQTYIDVSVNIIGDNNQVAITYNKLLDGTDEHFKKGAVLFMLKRDGKNLTTKWETLEERLPEKSPKECNCFIVKK
jgi:hypothetical protein